MANNLAASIEKWFGDQEDEFVKYGSDFLSHKHSGVATAEILVYTTKYHALTRVANQLFGTDVAILGRPGLPRLEDLQTIDATTSRLVFLVMLTLQICSRLPGFERKRPSNFSA